MTRSLSVPVNVKARSLRRIDSGGMIRVISATPRPATVDSASPNDVPAVEIGKFYNIVLMEFQNSVCLLCMIGSITNN